MIRTYISNGIKDSMERKRRIYDLQKWLKSMNLERHKDIDYFFGEKTCISFDTWEEGELLDKIMSIHGKNLISYIK